jgi:hypothetical protein
MTHVAAAHDSKLSGIGLVKCKCCKNIVNSPRMQLAVQHIVCQYVNKKYVKKKRNCFVTTDASWVKSSTVPVPHLTGTTE